jgi:hypothetical protein
MPVTEKAKEVATDTGEQASSETTAVEQKEDEQPVQGDDK